MTPKPSPSGESPAWFVFSRGSCWGEHPEGSRPPRAADSASPRFPAGVAVEVLPKRATCPAELLELCVDLRRIGTVSLQLLLAVTDVSRAVDDCPKDCFLLSFGEPPLDCPFHVVPFQLVACATRSLPPVVQTSRPTGRRAPLFEGNPTSLGGCASI